MLLYAPAGDIAAAAQSLASMEDDSTTALLTEPLLTRPFQDAYDGHLWVWGIPWDDFVEADPFLESGPVWAIGDGAPEPTGVRLQFGDVRLDRLNLQDVPFRTHRLPVSPLEGKYRLGDSIELEAVALTGTTLGRGDILSVELYWRALAPVEASYTVFVQVIDTSGVKAGQIDRLPCRGGCPTDSWRPGDLVGERYDVSIQLDAPAGSYRIIAGMYDLEAGEQLLWRDSQGVDLGPHLELGTLQVEE
jgi:hypothetical protein